MTDPDTIPDAFDPATECLAWKKAPSVIGAGSHTHVCRLEDGHDGPHECNCDGGTTFR